MNKTESGRLGENLARRFLQKQGYKILDSNFRSSFGEIDIIAREKDTLVFIEVKMRRSDRFGLPEESINPRKIRRLQKTIQYYLLKHRQFNQSIRIDVISIQLVNNKMPFLKHFKNITS